jgi:DNA-binding transcriptional LysR family regulator
LIHNGDEVPVRGNGVCLSDLIDHNYIGITDTSSIHHLINQAFQSAGFAERRAFQVASMATAVAFVRGGLGFTILLEMSLTMLRIEGLFVRPLEQPAVHREIGAFWSNTASLSPAGVAFRSALSAYFKNNFAPQS